MEIISKYVNGFCSSKIFHEFKNGKKIEFCIFYKLIGHKKNNENRILDNFTFLEITNPSEFFQLKDYEKINYEIKNICKIKVANKMNLPNEILLIK